MNDWIAIVWVLGWLLLSVLMFIGECIFEESQHDLADYMAMVFWPVWILLTLLIFIYLYFCFIHEENNYD